VVQAAGLPVPETLIVWPESDLTPLVDGKGVSGFGRFVKDLSGAAKAIGYPVFLRTGWGSGKHDWLDTCYVTREADLAQHVCNLVEWSACAGVMGLPTDVWAVREMLPTEPFFTAFRGMPICREFRVFVDGPEVVCMHAYWPRGALVEGFPMEPGADRKGTARGVPDGFDQAYKSLCGLCTAERDDILEIASCAGRAVGGAWSVDVLDTRRGWYLTDMAEASRSFHWDGCPQAGRFCCPAT